MLRFTTCGLTILLATMRYKVRGFDGPIGLASAQFSILEDLVLEIPFNGIAGLGLGPNRRIWHVLAPSHAIQVICPSIVAETTATSIVASPGSTDCVFVNNATN